MPKEKLKSSVSELRAHLEENDAVAPDNKESLSDLAARIEIMLNGSAEHWEEGLLEELEKQVILYEEDHPVISRVISQIITTLNGMGL
ncbi:MAG: DUF4404 family protein [Pseudomonadales bacterium]|nr:DUF4404 family protein [Pseudomonadales bacterium]